MKIKKFNTYLADLRPRFGTGPGKTRPVVVIQTNLLNDVLHPSTIICPISTNVTHETEILRVHLFLKTIVLKNDSDILVDQIRVLDNRRFAKHLGELNSIQKVKLMENLKILLLE